MKKILIAILGLFTFTNLAFAQIEGFSKVRVDDYFGGMNSSDYADKIAPNQGAYVANAVINQKGIIASRKGQLLFNVDTRTAAFAGVGRYDSDSSTSYLVAASGVSVIKSLSNGTSWTIVNSGNNLTSGFNTGFIQANDLLFVFNGQNNTAWYNNATWFPGGTWPTSPPTATTAAWLNNYLFLAGNPTHNDWIFVSDNLAPTSFQSTQVVKINTGDGQPIKRLEPYRTSDIIVYKTRSIFDFDIGNVNSTCSPQPICQWSFSPIVRDVGTESPRSVVSLGNDQWFLSSNPYGVRSVQRTAFDKLYVNLISQPIQDIFDGTGNRILNKVQVAKAAAVYFDNKYILAIPTGSSTVNDLVVVYDFITQSWSLIDGWFPADWIVFNNQLYYADANTGRVIQCFSGNTGDYGTASSTSGPSVAIPFTYISRIYDFDQPENFKQLDSISLELNPTGNYSATLYLNLDNGGWQQAGTIDLTGTGVTLNVLLPFTLLSSGISYSNLQVTRFGEFKKIQVKIVLNALSQQISIQKVSIFARVKPWRREN